VHTEEATHTNFRIFPWPYRVSNCNRSYHATHYRYTADVVYRSRKEYWCKCRRLSKFTLYTNWS